MVEPATKRVKIDIEENDDDGDIPEMDAALTDKEGRCVKRKYWGFTWYCGEQMTRESVVWKTIERYFVMKCTHASMQEERCPTTGRRHIQSFAAFDKAARFREIKELKPILHGWTYICTASEKSNKKYTQKSETAVPGGLWFTKGFVKLTCVRDYPDLYPWQQSVWDMVKEPCDDDRTIYWYWDAEGNKGKTALIKSLVHHMNAFLFEGKTADIANRVVNMRIPPTICIMNLRRSQEGHVNYNAIEALKDGLLATGKYEGGQTIFDSPHVVVFANFEPDTSALSADRWHVVNLGATPGAIADGFNL